ncbi:M48 family metallopeptidase [Tenacibaculum sp. nBUS_03]|uniref:M48 family metallopeptidase n=1 Tax=Tenacibaculum sp. nBUS_03 TaxID=3395320 RepID=UPI003EBC4938
MSEKQIIEFGNHTFNMLLNDLDIDEVKSNNLQLFINDMNINTTFPIKVFVTNNKELNAFALSGGKIVIYSSLLDEIENEHQLTALLGHEISHIENRHVLKNLIRNLSGKVFTSIIFNDFNSVSTILTANAHLFSQLSYTRSLEKEADVYSMKIMQQNNLNLFGMPELFQILNKKNEVEIPKYLNSHPLLKERILYTKKIAEKQSSFKGNVILKNRWNTLKQLNSKTNTKIKHE